MLRPFVVASSFCCVFLVAAGPTGRAANDGKHLLRYQFEKGAYIAYEVEHDVKITTQKGDAILTVNQQSQTSKRYHIVSLRPDGGAIIEPIIDRVEMRVQSDDGQPIVYDSESSDVVPSVFQGVKESIGKPLSRIEVGPNGELIAATKLIHASVPGQPAEPPAEASNDPSVNPLVVFPKNPVRIGESWKDQFKVSVTVDRKLWQPVTVQRQYTLESVNDGRAVIRIETALITLVRDPIVLAQLIQRTPRGKVVFDMKRGQIESRDLNIDERVIGFGGADSMMRAISELSEVRNKFPSKGRMIETARQPIEAPR